MSLYSYSLHAWIVSFLAANISAVRQGTTPGTGHEHLKALLIDRSHLAAAGARSLLGSQLKRV